MGLDAIKNLFWEDDKPSETTKPAESLQKGTPAQELIITPTESVIGTVFPTQPQAVPVGVVSEELSKHFNEVLDASKVPGVGYSQFNAQLDALESLKSAGVSESVRYETALKTLKAQGVLISKKGILDTAQKYMDLLAADDKDATKLVEQRKKEEIGTRNADITNLQEENKKKQELIQKLNQEIQDNNTAIGTKQGEIITQTNIIEQRHQNYKTTWAVYNTRLLTDIQNINTFLPEDAPVPVAEKKSK
jgi:hypothetical protein